ncbi:MAG: GNAT family N-acetyltransferase [Rikenellaceae bacterium]
MKSNLVNDSAITLRALEPEDLNILYLYENSKEVWRVSGTQVPFSRQILRKFIESAFTDIYKSGQLRLMIDSAGEAIGAVDIFDFDPHNSRAGVGIIIFSGKERQKGHATKAMELLMEYCYTTLMLHQLYCNISSDNTQSLALFRKLGFEVVGIKKDWNRIDGQFFDEIILQKIVL